MLLLVGTQVNTDRFDHTFFRLPFQCLAFSLAHVFVLLIGVRSARGVKICPAKTLGTLTFIHMRTYGSFPKIMVPQYRPQYTLVLIIGGPEKGTPNFGKPPYSLNRSRKVRNPIIPEPSINGNACTPFGATKELGNIYLELITNMLRWACYKGIFYILSDSRVLQSM